MRHFFNLTLKESLVKQLKEGLIYYTVSLNIYTTPEFAELNLNSGINPQM